MTNVMTGAGGRRAPTGAAGRSGSPGPSFRRPRGTGRAANPLLGLREFQHEYDDLQVKDQVPAAGVHREFRYRTPLLEWMTMEPEVAGVIRIFNSLSTKLQEESAETLNEYFN